MGRVMNEQAEAGAVDAAARRLQQRVDVAASLNHVYAANVELADYADGLAAEIGRLRALLEPFAQLAEKFPGSPVVEISEPHPDNPSPHIEPFNTVHFRRAHSGLATGGGDGR